MSQKISLIEHKSDVDYNVIMQVFRYITFIWEDYEKEMERIKAGISRTKDFRYPSVFPIVFYDGADNWTAATSLHERVLFSDILGKYIPDYHCIHKLVKVIKELSGSQEKAQQKLMEEYNLSRESAVEKVASYWY